MSTSSGTGGPERPAAGPDGHRGGRRRPSGQVLQVVGLVLLLVVGGFFGVRAVTDDTVTASTTSASDAGASPSDAGTPQAPPTGDVVGDEPGEPLAAAEPGDVLEAGPPIERASSDNGDGGDGGVGDALEELARSAEQAAGPAGSGPRARERTCLPAPSTTVRIATYNILGAGSRSGGGYDLARVRADIASWDVDVAILQEVYRLGGDAARSDQPADLAADLGMDWAFGYNARKGARTQYGTAVLSRFPIVEQANARLPNWNGLEQRGLLRATLDVGGTRLDVFDTHLQHTPQAAPLRTQQARSIAGMIGARRAATGNPAVLGGDFNSSPTGDVAGVLNGVLRDTWFDVGAGQGATHPAGRATTRIDRLYQSADVVPLAAAVRPSAASDHDAVTAVYEVPGTGRVCE
ncbi:endonuclease/exonuclease/phosphatase family protein [Nocardioides sp. AX2bis]|uniref:endonuclease/exonuclease/phosphatase family protein n=1 Tax=Nocardioides sp. AX2bis TaxID=2653157 RepID=UPI0012F28D67|nr:endonuclease/exonuclease/phosphatase family protein [Nocardioides sp. AX2bis]VXC03547.1 hypothetical protein NOCARDAX2BIS_400111 [Nocardioides sp. AX2bis]